MEMIGKTIENKSSDDEKNHSQKQSLVKDLG